MLNTLRQFADWGVRSNTPPDQAQHFRLTNVLLVFMFVASIIQTMTFFLTGATDAAVLNATAPVVFAAGLWLMKSGRTVFARVFVLSICYTAGFAVVASLGRESYFQFIFLFASAFSVVFFSSDEKWLLFFGLIAPLVCFTTLEMTHYAPVFGMARADLSDTKLVCIRIGSMAVIWSLMVFHFFYFIRDRRKSQEQLVSSAKMVAMGRMAAGIAHEVNNPLQLIVSHAERLKKIATSPSVTKEQIAGVADQIQSVAMRIGMINKGLLSLSRDASNDPLLDVPVHSIIKLSLDYCRARLESHHVELTVNEIPPQWTVTGRETQLSEVVLNVLNNAYDAVIERPQKRIQVEATADKEWVEIAIADSGPGVPARIVHRIFDPFFTTKPIGKGTGLGLSVSQGIMAVHGGQLSYQPKSTGACFVIRIPRAKDSAPHVASMTL